MQSPKTPAARPSPLRRLSVRRSFTALGGGLLALMLALSPLPFSARIGPATGGWAAPVERLRNGGFDEPQPAPWGLIGTGSRIGQGEGRNGSGALACIGGAATSSGAFQTVRIDQPRSFPLSVSAWSRAEEVDGSPDPDYALYVSVEYADGSRVERVSAAFDGGTHGWQRRELLIPALGPVKSLVLHCLFRNHAGRAWFDDVSVLEARPAAGSILFEGGPWVSSPVRDFGRSAPTALETEDGLRMSLRDHRLLSLHVEGLKDAARSPSGFLVRDAAAGGDWRPFDGSGSAELSLELETRWRAATDHLSVEGELRDLAGRDRAVSLAFLVPIDAVGGIWCDDVRRSRKIEPGGVYVQAIPLPCGATASLSRYPLGAVSSDRTGLALAADPATPAQFRVGYHAETRSLFISFDFGLLPDGAILPSRAAFRFSLFRFDGAEGFRGALQKFYGIYPERFARRCLDAGAWLPFTAAEKIPRWEDFGFAFREATMTGGPSGPETIRTFRYTEPLGWWTPLPDTVPRSPEGLRSYLRTANSALPGLEAAMKSADGSPQFLFQRQPWCDGVLWSMNPNPLLPGSAGGAGRWWSPDVRERFYLRDGQPSPSGEFVDSAEGYAMAELDFDRVHLRYSTAPPTWSSDTRAPVLFKGQLLHEYAQAAARDLRPLGKFLFGNGTPDRFAFLAPGFDILGTEVDWCPGGQFTPAPDSELSFRRAMAFQKPFCILLNARPEALTHRNLKLYFQRCLFYGMFPSLFSHDAQNASYWENPAMYERDRPLFQKYMPLLRRIAAAGWQPVTLARSDNPAILLERFGPDGRGVRYLTLLNDRSTAEQATVELRPSAPGRPLPVAARDLLLDERVPVDHGRIRIALPPAGARVLELREPDQK